MDKYILIFIGCISIMSCHFSPNTEEEKLEYALKKAGNNRNELEYVLEHYKDDTLKYKAACFLIQNMPYFGYYYESRKYDQYIKALRPIMIETGLPDYLAFKILANRQGLFYESDFQQKNDAQTISAQYLIKNIDLAFKVWKEKPWGKYISFDTFCQEILPYRIANEPLEDWRQTYYDYFQPILDSLQTDNNPLTACQIMYDAINKLDWAFAQDLTGPHVGGKSLFELRIGNCREYSDYMLYAMRAVGIPGGIDLILQNPDDSYREHYWNYVTDTVGKDIEFELYKIRPKQNNRDSSRLRAKVYRWSPSKWEKSLPALYPKETLPPPLNNPFIEDVSQSYFPNSHISIKLKHNRFEKLLYLCVFNNTTWIPIATAPIKNGKADFYGLEENLVYCPAVYEKGHIQPVTNPFLYKGEGHIHFFNPDTLQPQEALLTRKFYIRSYFLNEERPVIIGGKFQGSNDKDFKNAKTLYTIKEEPNLRYKEIVINNPVPFKYVRYLTPDSSLCSMAEIEFYSNNGTKLRGKTIGTEGCYHNNPTYEKSMVFDDDPITCYWSKLVGYSWVGLELNKPEVIQKIRYLPFNDDNEIREGDLYELFYFDVKYGFVSLGKQYGNREQKLLFKNIPNNAILWLRDHTRGKEERIFTYDNNKQIWR